MPEQGATGSATVGLPQGEMYRGDKIGNYEVLTQLSVGGMAELFLCFTQGAGAFRKFVVVKRILPDVKNNESYVKMFYDEARITSVLHHPNIAQVLDLGGEGEAAYIAMEFIQGQNLNQISAACLKRKRLIPLGLSVSVCRDICHALHYAHTIRDSHGRESPIIHRDVAQKNIMVTYDGAVKLLDFGIAKARGSLGRTTAGMVKGTTGYMSPEQVRGEALDGRSDVFCLGVVLFELLTGKRLFAAETETEEMERILAAPIPRPDSLQRKIPSGLVDLVLKALARDRNQRFTSARALAKALDEVGGKWMYDSDRRAAFMRKLFSERIDATRRLLESAGKSEETDDSRKAAHTLTEDAGAVFPELSVADTDPEFLPDESDSTLVEPAIAATPSPAPPAPQVFTPAPQVFTPAPRAPTPAPPPAVPSRTPVPRPQPPPAATAAAADKPEEEEERAARRPSRKWPLRAAAVAAMAAVAGALAFLQWRSPAPAPAPDPKPEERPAVPATGPAEPMAVVVRPAAPDPALAEGALSLATAPRAKVMLQGKVLGQSPLSEVPLPAGKHQLILVAADGTQRRMDVRIEPGKTTRANVRLSTLPRVPRRR